MNQAQELYFLEKLLRKVVNGSDSELIANKLLRVFGSADQAFQEIGNRRFCSLEIDDDIVEAFTCIHKLKIEAKYRQLAEVTRSELRSKVLEIFLEQVGAMQTYCVQFYYFSGDRFVYAGAVLSGTIDSVIFYQREVLSEALKGNANRVMPVIGIPFFDKKPTNELLALMERLTQAGEILLISVDEPILASTPSLPGAFRTTGLCAATLGSATV